MAREELSHLNTFFTFGILGAIVLFMGIILLIRGLFGSGSLFLLGFLFLITGGYMRFKYKVRKEQHQRGI